MKYMIELHHVAHEIPMYIEEIKLYGEIFRYDDNLPNYVWIESEWEKDILEIIMGVKKVWPKKFESIPLSVTHGRNWTELMGTKYDTSL